MTDVNFGLQFRQQNDQPVPVLGANMDVIGIIGPCSSADTSLFPLNEPVLIFSNDVAKLLKLGNDGYVADAVKGIADQLADFQIATQIVYVRTAYGTDSDANVKLQQTIANMMGSPTSGSGVWAFAKAPHTLHCTPRLICAPGYTGQMANSLDVLDITTVGTGYIPGQDYALTFVAGGSETNGANLVLPAGYATANVDGEIHDEDVTITSFGAWMTAAPTATVAVPDGPAITGLPASGSIIFNRVPGVGSTITLNGVVVSFVASGATGLQVNIAANDLATTLASLVTLLNATANSTIAQNTYTGVGGTLTIVQDANGVAGNGYTLATTVTGASLSGPHLTGGRDAASSTRALMTVTIALGANPVCAELTGVLDGLLGHAVVESSGVSYVGDLNWRSTMNSKRLIAVSGGVKVQDPISGAIVVRPFAPRVVGAIVARDFQTGAPTHSAANTPIQGIVGPARSISFSLTDGATEGQQLLAANLGIIARGEVGIETAISSGGFVFIGTDNCSDDPLWQFYNVSRGRDYIHLSMMPSLRTYLGRANIDAQTINNIIMTERDFINRLIALGHILGGKVTFNGALNSASEIRLGHLVVSFAAEEPPVLKRITNISARYRPAIDQMVALLQQQLNVSA